MIAPLESRRECPFPPDASSEGLAPVQIGPIRDVVWHSRTLVRDIGTCQAEPESGTTGTCADPIVTDLAVQHGG